MSLLHIDPTYLATHYGYWAVGLILFFESMGIPLPGESTLIAVAAYAGTTHQLDLSLIILAASTGAILGDNVGYWVGRELGFPLALRYGAYVGATEPRLKLGQYMFRRHGGKVVFFGRFVAFLRLLAAVLAGINRMDWQRFLLCNAAGGIAWSCTYATGGYLLGRSIEKVSGPVAIAALAVGAVAVVAGVVFLRRHEQRLLDMAERALPGPLAETVPGPGRRA